MLKLTRFMQLGIRSQWLVRIGVGKAIVFTLVLFTVVLASSLRYGYNFKARNAFSDTTTFRHLSSCDLVFRLGNGFFSNYFREYGSREKLYSHIGIVIFEEGNPYVIHSEANELTGYGKVKKEKLSTFIQEAYKYSFFRLNISTESKQKVLSKALEYLHNDTKFDLDFNITDDNKVYCTELIANCINSALSHKVIKPTLKLGGRIFYGFDDIYMSDYVVPISNRKHSEK